VNSTPTAKPISGAGIATMAAFASLFTYAVAMTLPQAAVNELGRSFRVSNTQLGIIFQLFMIGFFLTAVAGGRLSDKYGKLRVVAVGCVLLAAGMLLIGTARRFDALLAAAVLSGIGGGLAEVVAMAVVSDLYLGPRRTAMLNWSQFVFSVGATLQPLAFSRLLLSGLSWRSGFVGAAGLALICALLAAVAFTLRPRSLTVPHEDGERWTTLIKSVLVVRLSAALLLYVGAELGLASWIAVYLEKELSSAPALAAASPAVLWIGIGAGRLAATRLAGRISDRAMVEASCALGAVFQVALILVGEVRVALVGTFLAGVSLGPAWPTVVSIAGGLYPSRSGTVIGIVAAAGCLGGAIVPPLIGWFSDASTVRLSLTLCPVCLIVALSVLRGARRHVVECNQD